MLYRAPSLSQIIMMRMMFKQLGTSAACCPTMISSALKLLPLQRISAKCSIWLVTMTPPESKSKGLMFRQPASEKLVASISNSSRWLMPPPPKFTLWSMYMPCVDVHTLCRCLLVATYDLNTLLILLFGTDVQINR